MKNNDNKLQLFFVLKKSEITTELTQTLNFNEKDRLKGLIIEVEGDRKFSIGDCSPFYGGKQLPLKWM